MRKLTLDYIFSTRGVTLFPLDLMCAVCVSGKNRNDVKKTSRDHIQYTDSSLNVLNLERPMNFCA